MPVQLMPLPIEIPLDEIAAFYRRHHIRQLALFGSILREDFSPARDMDALIEFESGYIPELDDV